MKYSYRFKILLMLLSISFSTIHANNFTYDCLHGKIKNKKCQNMIKNYWKYEQLINKISLEEKIDPNLLKALIAYESNYKYMAKSNKSAMGLTQVIPSTARELGFRPEQMYIPENSIRAGAKYLRLQLIKFKDFQLALAAYNAGGGAVVKYNGIPKYRETRNYVKNITDLYISFAKKNNSNIYHEPRFNLNQNSFLLKTSHSKVKIKKSKNTNQQKSKFNGTTTYTFKD